MLAGALADDDPEGTEVLREVLERVGNDHDLKVLLLPPDAHRTINALQRSATVVLQKSLKEGFGLTVTEALWKSKPVMAGPAAASPCKYTITRPVSSYIRRPGPPTASAICCAMRTSDAGWAIPGHDFLCEHFLLDPQPAR